MEPGSGNVFADLGLTDAGEHLIKAGLVVKMMRFSGFANTIEDTFGYHKIVVALSETIRLMDEIDVVIEKHGGCPGAFSTGVKRSLPA